MIDINKKYKTKDGKEVRIYATDGAGNEPVHGAIKDEKGWEYSTWSAEGQWITGGTDVLDLIEVKPRIQRTYWVNIYPHSIVKHGTRDDADLHADSYRLACVKVEIDCEIGEGLTEGNNNE